MLGARGAANPWGQMTASAIKYTVPTVAALKNVLTVSGSTIVEVLCLVLPAAHSPLFPYQCIAPRKGSAIFDALPRTSHHSARFGVPDAATGAAAKRKGPARPGGKAGRGAVRVAPGGR